MRILELRAENVKRLQAVAIRPDKSIVEITGRNGQGKTSVLDSIWWALTGKTNIQAEPIRKGEDKASIRLDLGELKVTRTFTRQEDETVSTSIFVENADGARYGSPQKMLDALLGELSFDPLAFSKLDPKQQFETLKAFVPGVDFAEIERANKEDYDLRRDLNRRAKDARAAAASIALPLDCPEAEVDESELVSNLEAAGEHNAMLERRKAKREEAAREVQALIGKRDDCVARAKQLREEAARMDDQAAQHDAAATELQTKLDTAEPLPAPIDTALVKAQIDAARQANAQVAKRRARDAHLAEAERLEAASAARTSAMEQREADKLAKIAQAKLPVEGITFGDGVVLMAGVPFEQASDAEQLRASIAIAMAMNPKLRIVRVRDGSLLDADSMAILAQMAEAHDFQVWIETVASGRPGAIEIEDGHVKAAAVETEAA